MEPHTHETIRLFMRNCGYVRLYWLFRTNGFRKVLDNRHARAHFVRTVESFKPEWDSLIRLITDMTLGSQGRDDVRDMPLWTRINDQWNRQVLPRLAKAMLQDSTRPVVFLNDDLTSTDVTTLLEPVTLQDITTLRQPVTIQDIMSHHIFLDDDITSAIMEYAQAIQNTDGITLRIDDRERQ